MSGMIGFCVFIGSVLVLGFSAALSLLLLDLVGFALRVAGVLNNVAQSPGGLRFASGFWER